MASCISRASIFLPRYSGVRPTMSPAMNTARSDEYEHPVQAGPDPAEDDLAELDVDQGNEPAERREGVVVEVAAPQEASVVTVANRAEFGDAEADLLALHVPHGTARWAGRGQGGALGPDSAQ